MTSSIKRPRYVFIFALNTAKLDDKTQNVYAHNKFSIANNRINHAQLDVENGIYCPEGPYIGTEQSRLFTAMLGYKKNDVLIGSAITCDNVRQLFGLIYFDLRNQQGDLKSGSTQLKFRFTLSGAPNADYSWYCVLYSVNKPSKFTMNASGRVKIRH